MRALAFVGKVAAYTGLVIVAVIAAVFRSMMVGCKITAG